MATAPTSSDQSRNPQSTESFSMKRLPTLLILFIIGVLWTGHAAGVAPTKNTEVSNRVKVSLGARLMEVRLHPILSVHQELATAHGIGFWSHPLSV